MDHLSGGRVECAVGAAWNEPEHRELGIPFPSVRDRMDRLEEGVQVLKLLFTQDDVTFEGRQVRVEHATYRPRPVQQPHPPIWIGGTGRTRTLPDGGSLRRRVARRRRRRRTSSARRCEIIDRGRGGGGPRPGVHPAGVEPVDQRAVGRGEALLRVDGRRRDRLPGRRLARRGTWRASRSSSNRSCRPSREGHQDSERCGSSGVDDAEPIALGVRQDDEISIGRI